MDAFPGNSDSCRGDWSAAVHHCPLCGAKTDFRLSDSKLKIGYFYGAGTAHFSAEESLALAPAVILSRESDGLRVTLPAGSILITARPAHE